MTTVDCVGVGSTLSAAVVYRSVACAPAFAPGAGASVIGSRTSTSPSGSLGSSQVRTAPVPRQPAGSVATAIPVRALRSNVTVGWSASTPTIHASNVLPGAPSAPIVIVWSRNALTYESAPAACAAPGAMPRPPTRASPARVAVIRPCRALCTGITVLRSSGSEAQLSGPGYGRDSGRVND